MDASNWVAIVIAGLGIGGTLASTLLAQRGEAKRANRAVKAEAAHRDQDRRDALDRERREALRSDYREVLRFVTRTRLFVMVLRDRLAGLEAYSATASDDSREVEDLEARSEMLRLRLLEELPDVQSLVGVWAPENLLAIFDEIYASGPGIRAHVTTSVHIKVHDQRLPEAISDAVAAIEHLLGLLNQARNLLQAAQQPPA